MAKDKPVWYDKVKELFKENEKLKASTAAYQSQVNETIKAESNISEQGVGSGVWTAEEIVGTAKKVITTDCPENVVCPDENETSYNPKKLIDNPDGINQIPSKSGLYHTEGTEPVVNYKRKKNEKVISKGNSWIVFGKDGPGSDRSGYGAIGAQKAAAIDIVVGRASSVRNGKGPEDGAMVDNDFAADAARIYISQLTDIDKNFDLAEGRCKNITQRSGIGIKADAVRVIGREGVKIVTGKAQAWKGFGSSGETNCLGGKISRPAPCIELIAGNRTENPPLIPGFFNQGEIYNTMQGVARGENVVYALQDLHTSIDQIWSALFQFLIYQMTFNAGIGPALSPLPAAPIVGGLASAACAAHVNFCLNPLYHVRTNLSTWNANYLNISGYRYIPSRNVISN